MSNRLRALYEAVFGASVLTQQPTKENNMTEPTAAPVPPVPPAPVAPTIPAPTQSAPTLMQIMQEKLLVARTEVAALEAEIAAIPAHMHDLTMAELKAGAGLIVDKVESWFQR